MKTPHFPSSVQIKYFFIFFLQNFAVGVKVTFLTSTSKQTTRPLRVRIPVGAAQPDCSSGSGAARLMGLLLVPLSPQEMTDQIFPPPGLQGPRTYIRLYPCVEPLLDFTLSIIKHHTRCSCLTNSLTNQTQVAFPYCPAVHPHWALSTVRHYN